MIVEAHWPLHEHMAELGCLRSPLLMLGRQTVKLSRDFESAKAVFAHFGVEDYQELDPDGGDLVYDLNEPIWQIVGKYETVFNLGTLEHVWDTHTAWSNALRAVKPDGYFITVSPVQGWDGHGIHVTDAHALRAMATRNGFSLVFETMVVEPRGVTFWFVARKVKHIDKITDMVKPQQSYADGKKGKPG